MAEYTGRYTAVYALRRRPKTAVYTASVHGRKHVHGQYTVVYMAGRPTRPCTRAETARYVPCTRSCTRPIHSRVHVRLHGPCTRPRTRTVCRNGPHTAVACRLGTCTRPGRPTCRIHGPDGPCTQPCNGRPSTRALTRPCTRYVDGQKRQCTRPVYTASVHGRKRPCTRPVHCRVHEPIRPVHGCIHDTLHGRVDGRFRPCRWPVHVDTCTRPYTCRVHGGVHGPYMTAYGAVYAPRTRPKTSVPTARTQSCTRVV